MGEESTYVNYIEAFPDSMDHYPDNFGDKEKEMLKGCTDLLFMME
jgi:hypothetical protein